MALDISEVIGLANASIVRQGKAMQDVKTQDVIINLPKIPSKTVKYRCTELMK